MISEIEYLENIFRASTEMGSNIDFIRSKQKTAKDKLSVIGFPNKSLGDWRYYNFEDILATNYQIRTKSETELSLNTEEKNAYKKLISRYVFPETVSSLLVTLNGFYSETLSNLKANLSGVKISDFNDPVQFAHTGSQNIVERHFERKLTSEDRFFKIVNTALMTNGFLLEVEDDFTTSKTLQILHISNKNTFNQIRSLIYMGKNSRLNVMVTYVGLDDAQYFTNAVIETVISRNAHLKLDKIQNESRMATQMYTLNVDLQRDSSFEFNSYSFGANSSRDDITVDINGENANCIINGLYVVNQDRKSHHKITVNHNTGHSNSKQLFKGLLYDKAKAEFNGLINVCKNTQATNAMQLNKNLLLSKEAHIDSRPQLNILTDDVKCEHGSTVGQLNEEELFYLRSRGFNEDEAQTTLTYSFCDELIKYIDLESARDYVSKLAVKNLSESLKMNLQNKSVTKQCLNQ